MCDWEPLQIIMAAPIAGVLSQTLKKFHSATDVPEDFLTLQKGRARTITNALKALYDITKSTDDSAVQTDILPHLIVTGFDEEQIWQQLELENESSVSDLLTSVARLVTHRDKCSFKTTKQQSRVSRSEKPKKRDKSEIEEDSDSDFDSLEDEYEVEVNDEEDELEGDDEEEEEDLGESSDEELSNIKSGLEDIDPNDKFFDFTGDSDEDLNFDFGPLSKQGDINDALFDKGKKGKDFDKKTKLSKKASKKNVKKSVTFEDENESSITEQSVSKEKKKKSAATNKSKGSIVDDKFFKLSQLEEFLDREDRREERRTKKKQEQSDEESDDDEDTENIDMFGDIESDDEDLRYGDFFDPPEGEDGGVEDSSKTSINTEEDGTDSEENEDYTDEEDDNRFRSPGGKKDLLAGSDSEGEDVQEILGGKTNEKSTFEKRQEKLKQRIAGLEKDLLAEKAWQMGGEVSAGKRPENSLLQENLQFEYMSRLAPEITEETTKSLESIIIQRIKDKVWDDVERKVKQKETPFEYKKRIVLDQEKSKLSLGEIYEQEYIKQQQTEEVEEKEDQDHTEIKQMMQSLFVKLDALSNFHYTPKQAAPDVKIVTNQPSISIEEVAPVVSSDGKLLAPQEIQDKQKREFKGETEKTSTDKFRERKEKKKSKRERQKERDRRQKLVEKLNPGLGNKYSKEKAMKQLEKDSKSEKSGVKIIKDDKKQKTGLSSSKAFFTQLQDEVSSVVKSKQAVKRKKSEKKVMDSKKLKL